MITKNEAKALFNSLRSSLLGLDRDLKKLVDTRAWEPLGYVSLAEAWAAELADIDYTDRPVARAAAIYALFETGASDDDVMRCVKGVGPATVSVWRGSFADGVPEKAAPAHVTAMSRKPRPAHVTAMSRKARPAHSRTGDTYVGGHYRRPATRRGSVTLEGFSDDELTRWKKAAAAQDLDYRVWLSDLLRGAADTAAAEVVSHD